jgi:probable HAF family extracellular repeat protein
MSQSSAFSRQSIRAIYFIDAAGLVVCSSVALLLSSASAIAQPTIVDLGTISPGGASNGVAVSDDGSVVGGGVSFDFGDYRAFRWTSGTGIVNLGFLSGGNSAQVYGMNADGTVIVGNSNSSTDIYAYRWTTGSGMVSLGVLSGDDFSYGAGVSGDGLVVVGVSSNSSSAGAFRWTVGDGMQYLGALSGGVNSEAYAANHDGSFIVGQADDDTTTLPMYWTSASGLVSIGLLSGVDALSGSARDVSRYTNVVVGGVFCETAFTYPHNRAFRWTASGGIEDLGYLSGGTTSYAVAITGNGGGIIGQADSSNTDERAFIYTPTLGMVGLLDYLDDAGVDLTGWSNLVPQDISYDGTSMTGWGFLSSDYRGWVIQGLPPVCCPADYNCDGFLDLFDYDEFVADYEFGSLRADMNKDGFIDFFDFEEYSELYETGC